MHSRELLILIYSHFYWRPFANYEASFHHSSFKFIGFTMCFAVAYIISAKKNVCIPDEWIQDLINAKLKNRGKNSAQTFRMFWSGTNDVPNLGTKPNFRAPKLSKYLPTTKGVCYLCRIRTFYGKFSEKIIGMPHDFNLSF